MYVNTEGKKEVTYDAIVIGSGISGGFAAKELCEKDLKRSSSKGVGMSNT